MRRSILWPALLVLGIALLAGCGTSVEPTATVEPSATVVPTATVTATATAAPFVSPPSGTVPAGTYGGHIVALARADVGHFDVHQDASATLAARGPGLAYSRMLRLRTGEEFSNSRACCWSAICVRGGVWTSSWCTSSG